MLTRIYIRARHCTCWVDCTQGVPQWMKDGESWLPPSALPRRTTPAEQRNHQQTHGTDARLISHHPRVRNRTSSVAWADAVVVHVTEFLLSVCPSCIHCTYTHIHTQNTPGQIKAWQAHHAHSVLMQKRTSLRSPPLVPFSSWNTYVGTKTGQPLRTWLACTVRMHVVRDVIYRIKRYSTCSMHTTFQYGLSIGHAANPRMGKLANHKISLSLAMPLSLSTVGNGTRWPTPELVC